MIVNGLKFILLLICVSISIQAQALTKDLPFGKNCVTEKVELGSIEISEAPDWLFLPSSDGAYLAYSSAEDRNFLLHRLTQQRISIPGTSDFVFSPEVKSKSWKGIASVPYEPLDNGNPVISKKQEKKHYLALYSADSIFNCQPELIFKDPQMLGNYQTIGLLGANGEKRQYRIIAAREGLLYRDYEIDFSKSPPAARAISPARQLCPNQSLRLPKISPSGLEIAGFDIKTQTTKIFRIKGAACELVMDLGVATGKVDFSYDGSRLTYHRIEEERKKKACVQKGDHRNLPELHFGAAVFVMERKSRVEKRIPLPSCYSSIFPRFLSDGSLALQLIGDARGMPTQYKILRKP